jgi:hypothetical protein
MYDYSYSACSKAATTFFYIVKPRSLVCTGSGTAHYAGCENQQEICEWVEKTTEDCNDAACTDAGNDCIAYAMAQTNGACFWSPKCSKSQYSIWDDALGPYSTAHAGGWYTHWKKAGRLSK